MVAPAQQPDTWKNSRTVMFDRFRQLFSKPKPEMSDEAREFITKLAGSQVWILAIGLRGTPTVLSITDPKAFEIVAAHRIDVYEVGDDDSVYPLNYQRDGSQILPFFSSEERALHFLANSGFTADFSSFQPFSLLAGFVATPENEMFKLVLDPRSSAERSLTQDERLLLRSLCPGS